MKKKFKFYPQNVCDKMSIKYIALVKKNFFFFDVQLFAD